MPGMVAKSCTWDGFTSRTKSWYVCHLWIGAGFRNHPPYDSSEPKKKEQRNNIEKHHHGSWSFHSYYSYHSIPRRLSGFSFSFHSPSQGPHPSRRLLGCTDATWGIGQPGNLSVAGVDTGWNPSEKYESQLEWLFPIYEKTKVMFQSPPTSDMFDSEGPKVNMGWLLN